MSDICIRLAFATDEIRAGFLTSDVCDDCIGNTLCEDRADDTHIPYLTSTGQSIRKDAIEPFALKNDGICPVTREIMRKYTIRNDSLCIALRASHIAVATCPTEIPIYTDFLASVRKRSSACIEIVIDGDVLQDEFISSIVVAARIEPGSKIIVPIGRPRKRTSCTTIDIKSPPSTKELEKMWNKFAVKCKVIPQQEEQSHRGNIGTCPVLLKDGTAEELEYLFVKHADI
jgi:hypothetical protein